MDFDSSAGTTCPIDGREMVGGSGPDFDGHDLYSCGTHVFIATNPKQLARIR